MTTSIRQWSDSAAGNNGTVAGINFAEGQAPSTVNNSARELMAQVRLFYYPDEAGWIDYVNSASMNSQTVVKLTGDLTSAMTQGRRVRIRGGSATVYATVLSASFTAETALTIESASGSLSASSSIVGLAAVSANVMPRRVDKLDVSATLAIGVLLATSLDVSATLSVGGIAKFNGASTFAEEVGISGTLSVTGPAFMAALDVSATLSVGGIAKFASSVGISATLSVTGPAAFAAGVSVSATLAAASVMVGGAAALTNIDKIAIFEEQTATAVDGGTFSAGVQTRVLTTVVSNAAALASLTAGALLVVPGTYEVDFFGTGNSVNAHQAYLWNATANALVAAGASARANSTSTISKGSGRWAISATATLQIRHYAQTTRATDGFGVGTNSGQVNVFSQVRLRWIGPPP